MSLPELVADLQNPDHPMRVRNRHERALIRANNATQPRCANCGCDVPIYLPADVISAAHLADPHWAWLKDCDFSVNDILCFWCAVDIFNVHHRFIWGHA